MHTWQGTGMRSVGWGGVSAVGVMEGACVRRRKQPLLRAGASGAGLALLGTADEAREGTGFQSAKIPIKGVL